MAADVDQGASPRETRLILDGDRRSGESGWSDADQLQKCLQAMQGPERSGRSQLRARISDRQLVRLILAKLLNSLKAAVCVNR